MLKAFANAKINLLLDVTGREENGYHTVNNIMQTVSLQDTVTLSCETKGIKVAYDDGFPVTEKDICLKAARKYQESAQNTIDADIFIEKVIPTAAGLGGNSSAAAAVLALLNAHYGYLSEQELLKIAATLGADVPFFLIGGTALCSHYGEIITPVAAFPTMYVVIAKKGNKGATAEMYKKIDESNASKNTDITKMLEALETQNVDNIIPLMQNVFEDVSSSDSLELICFMKECGAKASMLSGSGPAVFGLFSDEDAANECCKKICEMKVSAYLCKTTSQGIIIE